MKLNESDVLEIIDSGENDAPGLLLEVVPAASKKFNAAIKKLSDLLSEIQQTFPDAQYYSGNGTVFLMLGDSHAGLGSSQEKLVALESTEITISGGDW